MDLKKIKQGLIVSCQALEDEPLHSSYIMAKMALAAQIGGAVGIRANSVADIKAIKAEVDLPTIGIIKRDYSDSEVYITPTKQEVFELLTTDVEIIATDATKRNRPHNEQLPEILAAIHEGNRAAMADISTEEEAIAAAEMGFDLVSTTMAGYTSYSNSIDEPDFELIRRLQSQLRIPVIMEGHTSRPEQVREGLNAGAFAVVVGSIITRPQLITKLYVKETMIEEKKDE